MAVRVLATEDRTTIAFAELIEREFGGFVRPPGYVVDQAVRPMPKQ
jgi:hypothetical protein